MNLTQLALMTYRVTGVNLTPAEFFERAAISGDDRPASRREAERVMEFCQRVQNATPELLPGETGEGNDLWCEANEVALAMRGHIEAMDAGAE